jgi:hypothetical protein
MVFFGNWGRWVLPPFERRRRGERSMAPIRKAFTLGARDSAVETTRVPVGVSDSRGIGDPAYEEAY